MSDFAARLKEARSLAGMTQHDLAEAVDVKPMTISRYETGHTKSPKFSTLESLARALRCDAGWLLTGKEPEDSEAEGPPDYHALVTFMETPLGKTLTDDELTSLRSVRFAKPPTAARYQALLFALRGSE